MSGAGVPVGQLEGTEAVSEIGMIPRRVLIANRGEIAVRVARTCRGLGIGTVAVFSDVDAGAQHVLACDQAVRLGGDSPATSYLRIDALLAASVRTGADAVHPGYGFLSENAGFARAVIDAGLTWIGPSPEVIAAMGDKIAAKRAMAAAGVPLVPGAELAEGVDVAAAAESVGYPLLVKAAAGGGGKGMRLVPSPGELQDAVAAARREASAAFGDGTVFLERYVEASRHVEVQVLGDVRGDLVHLFERECSIQRRHQKVVEEAPSPGLDDEVRGTLLDAAVTAARAIGYVNAGTVEFLADEARLAARRAGEPVDPRACIAFLEVNTRLQVEHPVTEATVQVRDAAGTLQPLDLVREQLLVAGGAPLTFAQDDLVRTGHAIEVRLYAEDPAEDYLPRSGTLHAFGPAHGAGIRWDTGVAAGDEVSTHYDPMLAKVIASAPTRAEAASRLARELDDTVLLGVTTNRDRLVELLRDPPFLAGETTTDLLAFRDADVAGRLAPSETAVTVALVAATLAAALDRHDAVPLPTVRPGFTSAGTFAPEVTYDVAGRSDVAGGDVGQAGWRVVWDARRDGTYTVTLEREDSADGHEVRVHELMPVVAAAAPGVRDVWLDLEVDRHRLRARITTHAGTHAVATALGRVELVERPRFPDRAGEVAPGATLSPMPGAIGTVVVAVGDTVTRGQLLCTVEAMKMEHRVTAPVAGEVAQVRVVAGQQVDADEVLVVVAPEGTADGTAEAG